MVALLTPARQQRRVNPFTAKQSSKRSGRTRIGGGDNAALLRYRKAATFRSIKNFSGARVIRYARGSAVDGSGLHRASSSRTPLHTMSCALLVPPHLDTGGGDAVQFNPTLMEFAGHYRYEPRPVAPARGNEKGRVERAIRYVRDSFFAARTFTGLADLNAQVALWCNGQAADRICPANRELRVREAFEHEQLQLLPLPDNPFNTDDVVAVHVGKTPYVRFDLNDYSVPHTNAQRIVTVRATPDRVRILDGLEVIAEHPRSYDRGAQIEDKSHIAALVARKRQARDHRGANRLTNAVPASKELFVNAAARGSNLGSITLELLRLVH